MSIPKIHEGEYRFCLILWEHEPVSSGDLARLCADRLGWKRTTTYTIIKRLGERGVLKNEGGIVTSLVSKEESQSYELGEMMEKRFEGSLPAFFAAFTRQQKLTDDEFDELEKMIKEARSGGGKGGGK